MTGIPHAHHLVNLLLFLAPLFGVELAEAAARCERNLVANVVALDQPLMFNRLGAQNVNGMIYALRRDVVDDNEVSLAQGGAAVPGKVTLRPDKRPRPLVLRVAAGDCLTVNLQNLLAYQANPGSHEDGEQEGEEEGGVAGGNLDPFKVDEQVADRHVGFQVNGLQAVNSVDDISSFTGRNANTLIPQVPAVPTLFTPSVKGCSPSAAVARPSVAKVRRATSPTACSARLQWCPRVVAATATRSPRKKCAWPALAARQPGSR